MGATANQWTIEVSVAALRRRLWQMLPATLSWGTLAGLSLLSFIVPFWIAIFVIAYDVYALIRAVYMSIHLIYAYRRLRREADADWEHRCQRVSAGRVKEYEQELAAELRLQANAKPRRSRTIAQLREHLQQVRELNASGRPVVPWRSVHHAVIYPTYDESLEVLVASLNSLVSARYPHDRLHVVVGFEERAGASARARAAALSQKFGPQFATFVTSFHPDGLPGETRVKSANAAWAMQALEVKLKEQGIGEDNVLVSNFDCDTVVSSNYFAQLTYAFITHPRRFRVSYQPLPMYNNNVWDAPAFSRVIAAGSTFWQMIEATRPERLVTFSSHSMSLRALKDVGYWQKDIVSEDSRIFWQCLVRYDGDYQVQPIFTTVSMDAALSRTWWQTFLNQYKQKRRWAWGIENFVFIAEAFYRNRRIPRSVKTTYLFRTLEGHHSWATAPIILAGLGWLPLLFGGPDFHATVLSYSLPYVARAVMSIAMLGLIVSSALGLLLLPARPRGYSQWRYATMLLQWALVPVIATVLSALPALDAETRLFLGRDLKFNVMEKARKHLRN